MIKRKLDFSGTEGLECLAIGEKVEINQTDWVYYGSNETEIEFIRKSEKDEFTLESFIIKKTLDYKDGIFRRPILILTKQRNNYSDNQEYFKRKYFLEEKL
jgi:hypothetical protein